MPDRGNLTYPDAGGKIYFCIIGYYARKKELEYPIMDDGSRLSGFGPWIVAIILLFCAMYFAITETAFSASSRPRLKALSETGNKKAGRALLVLDDFDRAISTILICTNIIHLSIASIVTVAVTKTIGLNAVAVSTIITTMTVFFAGEMLPKTIAKKFPEPLAMATAPVLKVLMTIFTPFSALLSAFGNAVTKMVKGEPEISVTEDELYDIIEDMTEEGALDEEQGDLISSALQFGDLTVESILTPRVDMVYVNVDDSVETILATVQNCKHSRLPVYEENIDNIVGVLQIRKFIKEYLKKGTAVNVRKLLDKPFFIHQSAKVDDVLPLMSKERQNIAIVTDNYGGTLGLVTIEDMLEELVGEIWDEDDDVEEPLIKIDDSEVSVSADEHVQDVFEELAFQDPENDESLADKVLGAWAFEKFGSIPKTGDSFNYHGLVVEVAEMDHNRIVRLKVRREE